MPQACKFTQTQSVFVKLQENIFPLKDKIPGKFYTTNEFVFSKAGQVTPNMTSL